MRLVIEEDQASGSYVYKTVNRLTGEVVQQLPRAEVLRLRQELQYAAGAVIKTEA
jgi:flagellar protein FlaG